MMTDPSLIVPFAEALVLVLALVDLLPCPFFSLR